MSIETKIAEKLPVPALLEQLAEEAAELAQAALKYARILRGENPTPVNVYKAHANLIEEKRGCGNLLCGIERKNAAGI